MYYLKAHNAVLDNNFGNICITKLTCSIDLQRKLVSKNEVVNCLVGLKVYQQKPKQNIAFLNLKCKYRSFLSPHAISDYSTQMISLYLLIGWKIKFILQGPICMAVTSYEAPCYQLKYSVIRLKLCMILFSSIAAFSGSIVCIYWSQPQWHFLLKPKCTTWQFQLIVKMFT